MNNIILMRKNVNRKMAVKLMNYFERCGFSVKLFDIFYERLNEEKMKDFNVFFLNLLGNRIKMYSIIDARTFFYIEIL